MSAARSHPWRTLAVAAVLIFALAILLFAAGHGSGSGPTKVPH